MAGGYKSYLIKASTLLAFGIIWAQHFWCLKLQTQHAQVSQSHNVSDGICCSASHPSHLILPEDRPAKVLNWSSFDRTRKKTKHHKSLDLLATSYCQSFAEQTPWQKFRQNSTSIGSCLRDDDDDDAFRVGQDVSIVNALTLTRQISTKSLWDYMLPLPVLWLLGIFEFFDLVLNLQTQDDKDCEHARRHAQLLLPLRLIRYLGVLLCIGLVMQRGFHVLLVEQLPQLHYPSKYNATKVKQKNCKNRQHELPAPFSSLFGTSTTVHFPQKQVKALSLHIVGDGNCMWRA